MSMAQARDALAGLVAEGTVIVEQSGRHRYFRAAAAVTGRTSRKRPPTGALAPIRAGRTCYGHLAGVFGVAVTDALRANGYLIEDGARFELSDEGEAWSSAIGIDVAALRRSRRKFAPACLDWTERRHHIGGALGAALAARMFELGWIERHGRSRAIRVTRAGVQALTTGHGIALETGLLPME